MICGKRNPMLVLLCAPVLALALAPNAPAAEMAGWFNAAPNVKRVGEADPGYDVWVTMVECDDEGNIYVMLRPREHKGGVVGEWSEGGQLSRFLPTGQIAWSKQMTWLPTDMTWCPDAAGDDSLYLVSETRIGRIRAETGREEATWPGLQTVPQAVYRPTAIGADNQGHIYICDGGEKAGDANDPAKAKVAKFRSLGGVLLGGPILCGGADLVTDRRTGTCYAYDSAAPALYRFDSDLKLTGQAKGDTLEGDDMPALEGWDDAPTDRPTMAVDWSGRLFVLAGGDPWLATPGGEWQRIPTEGKAGDIAFDPQGNMFVAPALEHGRNGAVLKYSRVISTGE